MSSDGYFEGHDFDDAAFEQLDAIEAALLTPAHTQPTSVQPPQTTAVTLAKEASFYDLTFDIEDNDLEKLDNFIEDAYQGKARPVAGPSRTMSRETLQTNLHGDILSSTPSTKPKSQSQRPKSTPRNPFGQQASKTKQWDQTAFAKSGLKSGRPKGKAKTKASLDNDEGGEEEVEFEQFPAPFVSSMSPPAFFILTNLIPRSWVSILHPMG